jgi:thiamine biosynthesis lipoprotein
MATGNGMNRRDFLNPRSFASLEGTATLEPAEVALVRFARRAMGTTFEVVLPLGSCAALEAAENAFAEINRLESQLTVYRESSEVSRLNRMAAHVEVPVEEGLFELLYQAEQLSSATEGAFDVSAGALIKAWGFFRGPRRVPSDLEIQSALGRAGMKHVVLDREKRSVCFLRSGLEINLGSIGKGFALDRAATVLRQECEVISGLVHGGHSSVYAIGSAPGSTHGWEVGIRHPWDPERRLAIVRLRDAALGTSAATFQHLDVGGRKLGHLLDPRSGQPAQGIASASAVAESAAQADALATAFYVMGLEGARGYCALHPEIGAVLLPEGHGASPVVFGIAAGNISLYEH